MHGNHQKRVALTKTLRCMACAILLCMAGWTQAADFAGKVIAVLDGDTLLVLRGSKPVKVRLAGIDAPEKDQPYGIASQQSLAELVMDKQVRVVSRAVDDYGRLVANVFLGEINVNHEQVGHGMAWAYSRFDSKHDLLALQRDAQQAGRGLWADEAIEPVKWRRQHPRASAPSRSIAPDGAACGNKTRCSEMASCEEARHYLADCGVETMDGNGDGVPCEALCAPE